MGSILTEVRPGWALCVKFRWGQTPHIAMTTLGASAGHDYGLGMAANDAIVETDT